MYIKSEKELKSVVSALRRELNTAAPGLRLGHSQVLEMMAKALGASNLAHLQASLRANAEQPAPVAAAVSGDVWRLSNDKGQLDLVAPQRQASDDDWLNGNEFVAGIGFADLQGTLDDILGCTAGVQSTYRAPNGQLMFDHGGETNVNWDNQQTRRLNGERLWADDFGTPVRESECVLVPGSFDGMNCREECSELPVRSALVRHYAALARHRNEVPALTESLAAHEDEQDSPLLDELARIIGFTLHWGEYLALQEALSKE